MGLKATFKPACPKCDFKLKYYAWDPQTHPDNWVLTDESRDHLAVGHLNDNVVSININRRRSQPRFRINSRAVRKLAS